jgi:hypothetical protein
MSLLRLLSWQALRLTVAVSYGSLSLQLVRQASCVPDPPTSQAPSPKKEQVSMDTDLDCERAYPSRG